MGTRCYEVGIWAKDPRLRGPWDDWRAETGGESGTFPAGEVRMLEIVLVEVEATQEVVGGLGKWAPCQKVSEKLGYPAGHRGRLLHLQKGDLLPVCTVKRGGNGVSFRKWYPWAFTPASVDSQRPESPHSPKYSPTGCPTVSLQGVRHLPRLAWSCVQRSQNWLGSEDQYKLSWRLAAYRLLQIPENRGHVGEECSTPSQPDPSPKT